MDPMTKEDDKIPRGETAGKTEEFGHGALRDEDDWFPLGTYPDGHLITESGLARVFRRHPSSVKRAVDRGELPPPIHLMKRPVWTVGVIRRHLDQRLQEAQREREDLAETLTRNRETVRK